MINERSLETVRSLVRNGSIPLLSARPAFDSYGFHRIPATIEGVLGSSVQRTGHGLPAGVLPPGSASCDTVVVLFVDAFGWRFFEEFSRSQPLLSRFREEGVCTLVTSQFPSTTAAHLTTFHFDRPVNETGIYEWYYFDPTVGTVVSPLLFAGGPEFVRENLLGRGVRPEQLFPFTPFTSRLSQAGIRCFSYLSSNYHTSSFAKHAFSGSTVQGFGNAADGLKRLATDLADSQGPRYFFFYFDGVDSAGHTYGPSSVEFRKTVEGFFETVERELLPSCQKGRTLLFVTADHGQVDVDPKTTIYLDRAAPEILELLDPRFVQNFKVIPTGSARDLFLHVRPGALEKAVGIIERVTDGRVDVLTKDDLFRERIFDGSMPGGSRDRLLERVGDLVVLPKRGETVWWSNGGEMRMSFLGHHGGLDPFELESSFLALAF